MKQLVMETTILKGSEVAKQRYETGLIPDVKNFEMEVVNLYPQKTYQTIEGFGAALTESAGYALSRMSEENFERVVQAAMEREASAIHWEECTWTAAIFLWEITVQLPVRMILHSGISA